MNRIVYMVLHHLPIVPYWFWKIDHMGKRSDQYPEQERYDYLRNIIKTINQNGRVTVRGYGEEQLPKENGFILFPNHQGFFDMLAIIDTCPKPLGVIIKKEAANWILVKQVLRLLGGIPMDRSDIRAAMEVIKEMTRQVKEGKNYVIFPEGTRSRKGNELLEFKAGTFKSAINAGCPIVPVALINSFRPFDISSIKKEQVEVHYLEPIYKEQYIGLKTREIADLVHDRIQAEIDRCIKVAK